MDLQMPPEVAEVLEKIRDRAKALAQEKKQLAEALQVLTREHEQQRQELASLRQLSTPGQSMEGLAARLRQAEQEAATLRAEVERLTTDLQLAKDLIAKEPAADAKGKKPAAAGPGHKSDKVKLFEALQENQHLTKELDRLRSKVKEQRSDAISGLMLPDLQVEIDTLVVRNRELERKATVLEQDKALLIDELKQLRPEDDLRHDVAPRLKVRPVPLDLPPDVAAIYRDVAGSDPVILACRTQQTVDTGLWTRRAPLYLVLTAHELVLLAAGRKEVLLKFPRERFQHSFYNPVTHCVVFHPPSVQNTVPSVKLEHRVGTTLIELLAAEVIEIDTSAEPARPAAAPAAATPPAAAAPAAAPVTPEQK